MAPSQNPDLATWVNERLDARAVIDAMAFHTDKLRLLGKSIKTPCMIHGDTKFATLIVMPDKNTYKCMVGTCPAFAGGTLVELFGLWKNVGGIEAALGVAHLVGMELDAGEVGNVASSLVDKARLAHAEGRPIEATELSRQAIALAPNLAAAHELLAALTEASGDTAQALAEYRIAAQAAMAAGDLDGAERLAREHWLRLDAPSGEARLLLAEVAGLRGDANARFALLVEVARAALERGAPDAAVAAFETVREALEGRPDVRAVLAQALAATGDTAAAIEQGLAAARDHEAAGQPARALDALEAARALDNAHPLVALALADLLAATARVPEAIDALKAALDVHSRDRRLVRRLLDLEVAALRWDDTAASARRLIALFDEVGDTEGAREIFESGLAWKGGPALWREEYADWLLRHDDRAGALDQMTALLVALRTHPDRLRESVRLRQRMVDIDPASSSLRLELAEARAAAGDGAGAVADLIEAAAMLAQAGQLELAAQSLGRARTLAPDDETVCERLAETHEARRAHEDAVRVWLELATARRAAGRTAANVSIYERVVALDPTDATHVAHLAEAVEAAGDTPRALSLWRDLGARHEAASDWTSAGLAWEHVARLEPGSRDALFAIRRVADAIGSATKWRAATFDLVDLLDRSGDEDGTRQLLDELSQRSPSDLAARERAAELDVRRGRVDEACASLRSLADTCAKESNPAEALRLLRRVGQLQPRNDDVRAARASLLEAEGDKPGAIAEWFAGAQAHDEAGDRPAALAALARGEKTAGADWSLLRPMAEWLRAHGESMRAIDLAKVALKAAPSKGAPPPGVLEAARFAAALEPRDKALAERLEALFLAGGALDEAVTQGLVVADLAVQAGDPKAARKQLEKLREAQPDGRRQRLALVALLEQSAKPAEAAAELVDLAGVCRAEDRLEEARPHLARAAALVPTDAAVSLAYAQCLEDLRDVAGAGIELQRIAGATAAGPRPEDALPLLDRLIDLLPDQLEARDVRMGLLAKLEQKPEAAAEALALGRSWAARGDGRRALALALRVGEWAPLDAELRREAAALMLQVNAPAEAMDQLAQAASAQARAGHYDAARVLIDAGLDRDPQNAALLGAAATLSEDEGDIPRSVVERRAEAVALDQAGRLEDAERAYRRLLDFEPDSTPDLEELVGVLQRQGPRRRLDTLSVLRTLCGCYLAQERNADAASCYLRELEIDPNQHDARQALAHLYFADQNYAAAKEQFLLLANALRARGDAKAAIDYLGKVIEIDPENADALASQIELTAGENRLAEFADYSLRLASVHEKAGRLGDAIATVRRILDSDKNNADVRLVLATYLARDGQRDEAAGVLLDTARRHLADKRVPKAMELLERVRAMNDLAGRVTFELGELLMACGEQAKGVTALRAAAADLATEGDIATMAGATALLARHLEQEGTVDDAIEAQLALARAQMAQGFVEDARKLLAGLAETHPASKLLRENAAEIFRANGIPELASAEYLALARLYVAEGDWLRAKPQAQRAAELRPRDVASREALVEIHRQLRETPDAVAVVGQLAELHAQAGSWENAARALGELVALQPEEPEHHERLAGAYDRLHRIEEQAGALRVAAQLRERRGETQQAIANLQALRRLRPDDTRVRSSFIRLMSAAGQSKEATEEALALADLHLGRGDSDSALLLLAQLLREDPQCTPAQEKLLQVRLARGDEAEALQAAIDLADLYLQRGMPREAAVVLQRVRKVGENKPPYHLAMAEVHRLQNARGMALREYQQASALYQKAGKHGDRARVLRTMLSLDPQNMDTRRDLVEALRLTGQHDESIAAQFELADGYANRGLTDLASNEYRAITQLDPANLPAWRRLFETHAQIGDERDLVPEFIHYADIVGERGDWADALHYLGKAIRHEPRSIEAREKYINAYLKIGNELELLDDYLVLADLLVAEGRVDDGIELYNKLMSLDPENRTVRDRLTETQARRQGKAVPARPMPQVEGPRPHEKLSPELTDTATRPRVSVRAPTQAFEPPKRGGAADFLADELDEMEQEDQKKALEGVIRNYLDILSMNPQNANVRIKLADLYAQKNDAEKMLEQLRLASETLLQKGDLNNTITVCERILKIAPTDQKVRLRLKQAFNKRDAFKALESAILFSDRVGEDNDPRGPTRS